MQAGPWVGSWTGKDHQIPTGEIRAKGGVHRMRLRLRAWRWATALLEGPWVRARGNSALPTAAPKQGICLN